MDGFCEEETERRDGNDHARHPTSSFGNLFTQTLFTETLFTETLFTKTVFTQTLFTDTLFTQTLFTKTVFTQTLFTQTLFTETLFTKTLFTQTFHKNPIKCCVSKINQIYPVMNQCSHAATEHVAVTM